MKLAILYDWLDSWGGAERVLIELSQLYPQADWYTLLHDPVSAKWSNKLHIRTSFIQKLPSIIRNNRKLIVPFMPFAIESFDFSQYTHLLSVTSTFSKAALTRPETHHISYVLSPPRFLWTHQKEYKTSSLVMNPLISHLKAWDKITAHRPDKLITISTTVQKRIKNTYGIEADVVYPPFDSSYWEKLSKKILRSRKNEDNYYLVVSRLEPYKMIELAINTFASLSDKKLIVIGDGSKRNYLQKIATPNITFVRAVSDENLACYYAHARALIMPQEEDFGYTALEAQACGCPVIAFNKGGATETIIDGKTGIFFDSQSISDISKTIEKYENIEYSMKKSLLQSMKNHLQQFDTAIFRKKFNTII